MPATGNALPESGEIVEDDVALADLRASLKQVRGACKLKDDLLCRCGRFLSREYAILSPTVALRRFNAQVLSRSREFT